MKYLPHSSLRKPSIHQYFVATVICLAKSLSITIEEAGIFAITALIIDFSTTISKTTAIATTITSEAITTAAVITHYPNRAATFVAAKETGTAEAHHHLHSTVTATTTINAVTVLVIISFAADYGYNPEYCVQKPFITTIVTATTTHEHPRPLSSNCD